MKTAVSLADDLFRRADQLARRMNKSRSQLYQEAITEYLARHDPDQVTEAMNRIADELDTNLDPFLTTVARQTLKKTEW